MRQQLLLGERDEAAGLALVELDVGSLGHALLRGDAQHAGLEVLEEEVRELLHGVGHVRIALDLADKVAQLLLAGKDADLDRERLHELARRTVAAVGGTWTTVVAARTAVVAARGTVVAARTGLAEARTAAVARVATGRVVGLARLETRELRLVVRLALRPGGGEIERAERAQVERAGVLLVVLFSHSVCLSGIP